MQRCTIHAIAALLDTVTAKASWMPKPSVDDLPDSTRESTIELPDHSDYLVRNGLSLNVMKDAAKLIEYGQEFSRLREEPITVLEIGVKTGASIRLWQRYFPNARIVGVDIRPRELSNAKRIVLVQGDQSDRSFLERLARDYGPFGLIIDDGSHVPSHQILTFEALFPHLLSGGVYVCEDVHTSLTKYPKETSAIDYFSSFVGPLMSRKHADRMQMDRSLWGAVVKVAFIQRAVMLVKRGRGSKYWKRELHKLNTTSPTSSDQA